MTNCREHDAAIDDVAAGAAANIDFATHLRTCAGCAAELERRRALLARIDEVTRALMNVSLSADIVVHVDRPQPWRIAVVGAVLAAALVVLFVAGHVLRGPVSGQTVVTWQSPTADLLRPTESVLDTRAL